MSGRWWRYPALLILVGFVLPAAGHEVRPAYLQITEIEPQRFEVLWKQPVLADRRLPIDAVLPSGCAPVAQRIPEHTGTALIQRWETACTLQAGQISISGLSATLTDALVRISYLNGDVISQILSASSPSLDLSDPAPGAGSYFLLGIEHLLLGIDHILFVVGLVLFIRVPWMLVKAVTAFTVAHSITLALSVLGLVKLPQGPVEAVIALSILFLARELMVPQARRSGLTQAAPWLMAFTFGLLHGFGFAGALTDIGLPRDQLAASLLLFNLGIEAGQLGIIAAMLAAAWLAHRAANLPLRLEERLPLEPPLQERALLERAFTTAMGCVAGFWTIDRILALT
jgi:hydrogenase/urease accessory protein HupE